MQNGMPLSTALCHIHTERAFNTFTTLTERFCLFRAYCAWPCTDSLSKLSLCSLIPSLPAQSATETLHIWKNEQGGSPGRAMKLHAAILAE